MNAGSINDGIKMSGARVPISLHQAANARENNRRRREEFNNKKRIVEIALRN